MSADRVVFAEVSKFYGEVLGVNRVDLEFGPGITALVGPNGSGKTTLMNLLAGLVRPTEGTVSVFGLSPDNPAELHRVVGYCTQYDTFPRGIRGGDFVRLYLRLHGMSATEAETRAARAIARAGMSDASGRRIAAYSKGMKQRIKLAQAIAHDPRVLVLDEPLNGLDPLARAEAIELFREMARAGRAVVISSHILHEVDELADRVVLIHGGYIVAEGAVEGVREEMIEERPLQVLVRCDQPSRLAAAVFAEDHVVEARIDPDRRGLLVRTADAERFHRLLGRLAAEGKIEIDAVLPADDDVQSVYQYLIGSEAQGEQLVETLADLPAIPRGPRLALRQIGAMLGLEVRKTFLRGRAVPLVLVGLLPMVLLGLRFLGHALGFDSESESAAGVAAVYAKIFQLFHLRLVVFFVCFGIFTYLVRGEVAERSLHFYLLTPLRREVYLLGKYLAGLVAAGTLFTLSVVAQLLLVFVTPATTAGAQYLFEGPGAAQAIAYIGVTLLGVAGYGAVFLTLALYVRNPMIPAAAILGWEWINFLLPPALKKISVIHYLNSLCPLPLPSGPFALPAEPTPAPLAIGGLLVLIAVLLTLAMRRARHLEVSYSAE